MPLTKIIPDLVEGSVDNKFTYTMINGSPINVLDYVTGGTGGVVLPAAAIGREISITNSTSKIIHLPLPSDDPKQREPVITKAKDLLKWNPKIERKTGLIQTTNYFSKKLYPEKIQ